MNLDAQFNLSRITMCQYAVLTHTSRPIGKEYSPPPDPWFHCKLCRPLSKRWSQHPEPSLIRSPDLLVGLAADPEHLLALELQLLGERADVLVERVDLVVQLGDVALPATHLVLELCDAGEHLALLRNEEEEEEEEEEEGGFTAGFQACFKPNRRKLSG